MARTNGTYSLSSNFELEAGAPLDARDRVATKDDLTAAGTFPYPWIGMETYVVSEGKKYRLIAADPTVLANWVEIGHKVQSDWNESDSSAEDFVLNKPTKLSDFTNDSGFVTTDEKVTGEEKNSNAGTWYNVPFIGTSNQKPYYNDGLQTYALQGTSSVAGRSVFQIGNDISTGTAGNKRGELRLYSEKNGYVNLRATASSITGRSINFPDNDGTLALTSEVTPYKGNLRTEIGNGTPAAATKTYWESDSNIPPLTVNTAYDNMGDEYTLLFSKGGTNTYGNILKWGYADKYLRILRKNSNGWLDSDWAKMDAGYADLAGKLNPYFCYYRVCALKTTLGSTITGGWYRVCKVEGASFDTNFIIHTSGDWNTTAPTNATVLVNTVNTSASITQLGGKLYTNMITKIRLVSVSGNIFWLDVYIGGSTSSVTRDNSQFLDIYGQVHVFEEQNPTAPYTQTATAAASIDLKAISGNVITSEGGTITGSLTGAGAKFQGRYYGSGDDEGIIIDFCSNNYAGLCLGSPTGKRSVFYLTSSASALPFWRYNAGSGSNYDIAHPGKSGTIALTSDIPSKTSDLTNDSNFVSSSYNGFTKRLSLDFWINGSSMKGKWYTVLTKGYNYSPSQELIIHISNLNYSHSNGTSKMFIVHSHYRNLTIHPIGADPSYVSWMVDWRTTYDSSNIYLEFKVKSDIGASSANQFRISYITLADNTSFTIPTSLVESSGRTVIDTYTVDYNFRTLKPSDNIASATKATQDGDGNIITSTYLKAPTVIAENIQANGAAGNISGILSNYKALMFVAFRSNNDIIGSVVVPTTLAASDGIKTMIPVYTDGTSTHYVYLTWEQTITVGGSIVMSFVMHKNGSIIHHVNIYGL